MQMLESREPHAPTSSLLALLLAATLASAQTKRPMTFEDMMHMKRLGSTAVSPDGKWLGYSVTTVDLDKTPKHRSCGCRPSPAAIPTRFEAAKPGDDGLQFAPDGKRIFF